MPHPPVLPTSYRLQKGVLIPDDDPAAPTTSTRLATPSDPLVDTEEIYLELAQIDLQNEDAILTFASRFRTLGVRHDRFAAFEHVPGFDEQVQPRLEAAWSGSTSSSSPLLILNEGIEDFRYGARCLRDLARAWTTLTNAEHTPAQWEALPPDQNWIDPSERAALADHGVATTAEHEAASVLERLLPPGLRPFQPRIHAEPIEQLPHEGLLFAAVPLYSICCLELYNHIVEHATYRRCPKCGRAFVRQRGRSQAGQHRRHGVQYCSTFCARAEASRKYRQRQHTQKPPSP